MKKLAITVGLLLHVGYLCAQEPSAEAEIRKLEETERRAILKKDTTTLKTIWDKDLIVNAPSNQVLLSGNDLIERPVLTQLEYSSFTREIEQILVKGNIVFSMGIEIVIPEGDIPKAGQTVKRRYTNIWMKQNDVWKLVARHASDVCE